MRHEQAILLVSVWKQTANDFFCYLIFGVIKFIPKLILRLLCFFRRTAALFRQIRTFPQLFRFCSDLGNSAIWQIVRNSTLTGRWWEGRILINLCGNNNVRNCDLLQSDFFARCRERGVAGTDPSTRGRSPVVLEVRFRSRVQTKAEIQSEIVLGYLHYLGFCTVWRLVVHSLLPRRNTILNLKTHVCWQEFDIQIRVPLLHTSWVVGPSTRGHSRTSVWNSW